ncbi:MAG: hypothetical protein HZC29_08860, partial [Thaumarchaeota archaeon]|nr:hypothetical protein [Nitrososphaerota archaeon]
KIIKRQEKGYVELPQDLAKNEEVELFQLRDGYYLLSIPLAEKPEEPNKSKGSNGLTDEEKFVLKKLLSIKFENRIPNYVNKALTDGEKNVLRELERKGLVSVYKGKKYVDGVYSIKDSAYLLVQGNSKPQNQTQQSRPINVGGVEQPTQGTGGAVSVLNSRGFIIITDKREALSLSEILNGQMKSGAVVGVKGFDGKFYVVTREYFTNSQAKITAILKDHMDASAVASATKLDPEGCIAVLRLMAENGELIEKKKGIFAPV